MKVKALIANDDMDVHQLMNDILEINFKDVKIDRALSPQSFWTKVSAEDPPYNLIFLTVEYIKEEPAGFMERLEAASPGAPGKVVLMGEKQDLEGCGEDVAQRPLLSKPFSLDQFEAIAKSVTS
jgi:DNA-binding NtrC family response regulator